MGQQSTCAKGNPILAQRQAALIGLQRGHMTNVSVRHSTW